MAGRFLRIFQPISRFMPEVSPPQRVVKLNEKLFWTAIALVLYLIMSEVPLYGIGVGGGWEMAYLRVIFASNRGSLMELGISPIVTAGLILQLAVGSGLVSADLSDPEDQALFTGASKVLSLVMIGVQASAYLIGGVYGSLNSTTSIVVFIELLVAGMVLMLLDELLQKGWGLGSGISLFILAGVARGVIWNSLLPLPGGDGKYTGALLAFVQALMSGEPLYDAFVRPEMPSYSMLGFIITLIIFLVVIYVQGVRVELPIAHARYRGFRGKYPINFLYVSNLPVIFASTFFADIYIVSQIVWSRFNVGNTNSWLNLLGQFQYGEQGPIPIGGLSYYVTSPRNIGEVLNNPLRALIFTLILVSFCVVFSLTWLEVGGLDPRTVARQLVDSGMQIPGFRRSSRPIELILKRYIPAVTILGGLTVGLIASIADFFSVFGTGMGVLLSVGILYQYYQILMKEQFAEMYPGASQLLGS